MKLNFLEKRLIETLTVCTVFTDLEVNYVYKKTLSWDKTIKVLKRAEGRAISLEKSIYLENKNTI